MPQRRPYFFNRTPKWSTPRIFGIETLEIYHYVNKNLFIAAAFFNSLYLMTWMPYWLCVMIFWLWPMDESNCTCCLKQATNFRGKLPRLSQVIKAARLGCLRCRVISMGLLAMAQSRKEWLAGQKIEDMIDQIRFRPGARTITISWRKSKGQWIAEQTTLQFYTRQSEISLPSVASDLT